MARSRKRSERPSPKGCTDSTQGTPGTRAICRRYMLRVLLLYPDGSYIFSRSCFGFAPSTFGVYCIFIAMGNTKYWSEKTMITKFNERVLLKMGWYM
jgi:hypothetical protein